MMATPVCFMVMPFRVKKTGAEAGKPSEVDFDALWNKALAPAIVELGYEPVRADQDLGALIITEMIERLALSDLVIADLTIPNGNVYYEVGVRHAAAQTGCVLIAAEWAKPLFDVDQMRQVRYPLAEGAIQDATASAIKQAVVAGVAGLKAGQSPVYQALPGYPQGHAVSSAASFKTFVESLSVFRAELKAVTVAPKAERRAAALKLRDRYTGKSEMVPFVALELLYLLRDHTDWQSMLDYVDKLPANVRALAVVREQRALAQAKVGKPREAVGVLEELVRTLGDTSERQGMIGGRYKTLYDEALKDKRTDDAEECLNLAIEHYDRGLQIDMNDYYPSSNLPRLYRLRGESGDAERANRAAIIALAACERARQRNPNDEWVRPTLLGLMFDNGQFSEAQQVLKEIKREGPAKWKLETTLKDLERSLATREPNDPARTAGQSIIDALKALLPAPIDA
jgi:tetratricopeptide (TPR) repeat protein